MIETTGKITIEIEVGKDDKPTLVSVKQGGVFGNYSGLPHLCEIKVPIDDLGEALAPFCLKDTLLDHLVKIDNQLRDSYSDVILRRLRAR